MVLLRRFESVAQVACRKGETPGFLHLYIGEEATAVGVCAHLAPDRLDHLHPSRPRPCAGQGRVPRMPDGGAVRQARRLLRRPRRHHASLRSLASACSAPTASSPAGISHAVGVGDERAGPRRATAIGVAFFGDGAINHGGFHESLNFAGVQRAPVVFVCENNLYATATPLTMATLNTTSPARRRPTAFPASRWTATTCWPCWRRRCAGGRAGAARRRADADRGQDLPHRRPSRGRPGHRHLPHAGRGRPLGGSATRSRPSGSGWSTSSGVSTAGELDADRRRVEALVDDALAFARRSPEPDPATVARPRLRRAAQPAGGARCTRRRRDGDDRLARRGARRHRRGDAPRSARSSISARARASAAAASPTPRACGRSSAPHRMVDTPISEQGFTGAAVGASATGARTVADLMFADFLFEAGRPDRAAGGEAPLHEQRPDERADGGPRRRRRGAQRRPAPQRRLPSDVGACAGTDRLPARRRRPTPRA